MLVWAALDGEGEASMRELLDAGADIHERALGNSDTVLMCAAKNGDPDVVRLLLDRGADVHQKNDKGETALHYAAEEGHTEIMRLLIDKGADVHERGNLGNTALIYTAPGGYTEAARLLIDRGISLDEKNNFGRTALVLAAHHGHVSLVRLLIDKGAKIHKEQDEWPNDWSGRNKNAADYRKILQMLQEARVAEAAVKTAEAARIEYVSDPHLHRNIPKPKLLQILPKSR